MRGSEKNAEVRLKFGQLPELRMPDAISREFERQDKLAESLRLKFDNSLDVNRQLLSILEGSSLTKLAREVVGFYEPSRTIADEYRAIALGQPLAKALAAWSDYGRVQSQLMRTLTGSTVDLQTSVLASTMSQALIPDTVFGRSIREASEMFESQTGVGAFAKMLSEKVERSFAQTRAIFEIKSVSESVENYLKDFARVNDHWKVPQEVVDLVAPFKALEERFGSISLPTIDWTSAAALAQALRAEGIEEQLALVGIQPDGSLRKPDATPERGLLSRGATDALAIVSLILGILFFIHQESTSAQPEEKTEAFQAEIKAKLETQARQIASLTALLEQALVAASQARADRYVVRTRPASVRAAPWHGSPIDGTLLPNEVVTVTGRDGMWVQVEYYHWVLEEYRTGWVLKKYLERVPASFEKSVR